MALEQTLVMLTFRLALRVCWPGQGRGERVCVRSPGFSHTTRLSKIPAASSGAA
jgi:hypothetical protein